MARAGRLDQVGVLEHGVDGSPVPAFAVLLLGGPDLDELAELAMQEAPAGVHVPDQRLGLVLGQQGDAADFGIDAVRQDEIDDSVLPSERHRSLRLPGREPPECATPAAGEDQREHAFATLTRREAAGPEHGSPSEIWKKRGSNYKVCNRPPKCRPELPIRAARVEYSLLLLSNPRANSRGVDRGPAQAREQREVVGGPAGVAQRCDRR